MLYEIQENKKGKWKYYNGGNHLLSLIAIAKALDVRGMLVQVIKTKTNEIMWPRQTVKKRHDWKAAT